MQSNCSICGRPLTDPDSISKGIGPICYSKNQFDTDSASDSRMELLPDPINDENGIILKRKDNGRVTDFNEDVKNTMSITGWSRQIAENAVRQWWGHYKHKPSSDHNTVIDKTACISCQKSA